MRISWCSVNARMGAKPVSLRIKSASVNGVLYPTGRGLVDRSYFAISSAAFNLIFCRKKLLIVPNIHALLSRELVACI